VGAGVLPRLRVLVVGGRASDSKDSIENTAAARFRLLGYSVAIAPVFDLKQGDLSAHQVVFLPTAWANSAQTYSAFQEKAPLFLDFVKAGGGLIVGQPNPFEQPGKICTPKLLPYPITFYCMYEESDSQRINLTQRHYITEDLPPDALPFPADQMREIDRKNYQVLVMGARSESPSLAVTEWGQGRVVVITANENPASKVPFSDELLRRIVTWAAGREPERFKRPQK
jgi:hypothetical protein